MIIPAVQEDSRGSTICSYSGYATSSAMSLDAFRQGQGIWGRNGMANEKWRRAGSPTPGTDGLGVGERAKPGSFLRARRGKRNPRTRGTPARPCVAGVEDAGQPNPLGVLGRSTPSYSPPRGLASPRSLKCEPAHTSLPYGLVYDVDR